MAAFFDWSFLRIFFSVFLQVLNMLNLNELLLMGVLDGDGVELKERGIVDRRYWCGACDERGCG